MQDVTEDTVIPLEKSKADLLMIAGEDDHNSDSVRQPKDTSCIHRLLTAEKLKI